MKQTAMDSDVLFLPHEIIRNILKRLPVKSLIRFQCVCKDWKNLIQNPSFIADHLQHPTHQNPSLLLECNGINIPLLWRLILLDCGLQVRGVQNSPSNYSLWNVSIVGSCNGLLCLETHQFKQPHSLSLWNPATTAVRHVPRTRTDIPYSSDSVTGFGFSPIVNDYKIVRIYAELFYVVTLVEVFSLNRGTWKAIDIRNLKGVNLKSKTVTANGAIFWSGVKLVGEKKDKVDVIVSFDIAKEVLTVIPQPELDYNADENLTVYENKLAILCDIGEDDDEIIDLWVLDEGTCASGQTWSWTKRYTSSPFSCKLDSMTIWRNEIVSKPESEELDDKGRRNVPDMTNFSWNKRYIYNPLRCTLDSMKCSIWRNEIVCKLDFDEHDDKGRRNVLYMMNLTTNEVKRSVIPGCHSILRIYNYVESLVSVGNN